MTDQEIKVVVINGYPLPFIEDEYGEPWFTQADIEAAFPGSTR